MTTQPRAATECHPGADRDRATVALLWAACHRQARADLVQAALEEGADASRAVTEAVRHGITALLW
ncbi:MAG TPA: hypothetical protein VKR22_01385, partial [Acidimicrobiales bacterium]|nr:hypothetical protein [Acidimicrobiales bacterium]